jgi:hypothetical protein
MKPDSAACREQSGTQVAESNSWTIEIAVVISL